MHKNLTLVMPRLAWHLIIDTGVILLAIALGVLVEMVNNWANQIGAANRFWPNLKWISQLLFAILAAGYVIRDFYKEFWLDLLADTRFGRWLARNLERLADFLSARLLRRRPTGTGDIPIAAYEELAEELFLSYDAAEAADAASPR